MDKLAEFFMDLTDGAHEEQVRMRKRAAELWGFSDSETELEHEHAQSVKKHAKPSPEKPCAVPWLSATPRSSSSCLDAAETVRYKSSGSSSCADVAEKERGDKSSSSSALPAMAEKTRGDKFRSSSALPAMAEKARRDKLNSSSAALPDRPPKRCPDAVEVYVVDMPQKNRPPPDYHRRRMIDLAHPDDIEVQEDIAVRTPWTACGLMSWEEITEHAGRQLDRVKKAHVAPMFKFGITQAPDYRFKKYKDDGWLDMTIVFASPNLVAVEQLERYLIRTYKTTGCMNEKPGGDGGLGKRFPDAPLYYTYIVGQSVTCGHPVY